MCPPSDTTTNLNNDLMNAENATLDKVIRDELVLLAADLLDNNEPGNIFEELKSVNEKNKWLNWYNGFTRAELPDMDLLGASTYSVSTTAVPGFASSPLFRQNFTEETFLNKLGFELRIYPPSHIGGNLSMVMKVQRDTKDGTKESFTISIPGQPQANDNEKTGYIEETLRFPVARYHVLDFLRNIDNKSYAEWATRRMTGFSVSWHLENSTGHIVDIRPKDKYSGYASNTQYVRIVNILHHALTVNNISVDKVWKDFKAIKVNWQELVKYISSNTCSNQKVDDYIIEMFLNQEEQNLNITGDTGPAFKDDVTESTLSTAVEIYAYLTYCPSQDNLDMIEFYIDLFRNFPPRFILQTLADLSKAETGNTKERNIPADLVSRLDKYLHLDFLKIDLATDTTDNLLTRLDKGQLKKYGIYLEKCADGNNCSEIIQIMKDIGSLLLDY